MAKLCPAGKAAARKNLMCILQAYANIWAHKYCKGKVRARAVNKIPIESGIIMHKVVLLKVVGHYERRKVTKVV